MTTNELTTSKKNGSLFGVLSSLTAIATAGSVAMIGFTSFTAFNPPDWFRIATMAPLPLLLILSVGFGIMGLKQGSSLIWAVAGLVLAGLSLIAFIIMINVVG
ncbi:MAG: hypothetical protein QM730_07935 [Anaerolineales bacterium]